MWYGVIHCGPCYAVQTETAIAMPIKKPPLGLLFLTYLVSVFFLAGYPVGFWLVVIGGIFLLGPASLNQ
jgi:hypothetical protein